MTYYKTMFGRIQKVEVERETDNSVWMGGRRRSKQNSYERYFLSYDEAANYLISEAENNVERCKEGLAEAEQELKETLEKTANKELSKY